MSTDSNQVLIFDTTLRDGEQSPGASMNLPEKIEVARALEALGVDIIEAGFPITSQGDFDAVQAICKTLSRARICGLARSVKADIDRAAQALAPAKDRGRIHVFLATSAIHRQHKLKKAKEEIIRMASEAVKYACGQCGDVEFSPEDASRTEPEFLTEVVQAVIDAGAKTVNIPDTVGYAYPEDFAAQIGYLFKHVKGIERAVISVHCHNDLGLAVSNSLSAVRAGARQVECTINGIGERAGNCSLEEVVMAMRVRKDLFQNIRTGIVSEHLFATSRLLQSVTGLPLARNKAIVGDNAFAHESGIHQDGMIKNPECYEIMTPASVGVPATNMVMGKHSGRAALVDRLAHLGLPIPTESVDAVFAAFKDLADRKKDVYDADLIALVESVVRGREMPAWSMKYLNINAGSLGHATATITLLRAGIETTDAATAKGPVDAIARCMDRICDVKGAIEDYRLRSVSKGQDALGEVSMRVRIEDTAVGGKGLSTDVLEASAMAYLDAINRAALLAGSKKSGTQP